MSVLERAVLGFLLEHHAAHLSLDEIVRAMTARPDDFAERDAVQTALGSLSAYGLLHNKGEFWFASLAATRFDGLQRDC
jgi:hypothetical protein